MRPAGDKRSRVSAGIVLYRRKDDELEVFLAHPGGPFFKNKDAGHWTIPKGEIDPGEDLLGAALRELEEEVGIKVSPQARFLALGSIQQKGGKIVHAWGVEAGAAIDIPQPIKSNLFKMEWPPGSGRMQEFPEVDRARFFPLAEARQKLKPTQVPLLDRLEALQ